jgi:hypothetical protein
MASSLHKGERSRQVMPIASGRQEFDDWEACAIGATREGGSDAQKPRASLFEASSWFILPPVHQVGS